MAKYRFKKGAGKHRTTVKNGAKTGYRLLVPGEVVELSDEQYQACKDKFEPTDQIDDGPTAAELRAMADAKEQEEKAAAKAKAEAEKVAKADADKAAKAGSDQKG